MEKLEFTVVVHPVRNKTYPYPFQGSVRIGDRIIYGEMIQGSNLAEAIENMKEVFAHRLSALLNDR